MSSVSAHPERLLLALDESLDHKVRLIIYGVEPEQKYRRLKHSFRSTFFVAARKIGA